ncbi:hypothetical protein D0Y65_012992, partial [Glycine soja]
ALASHARGTGFDSPHLHSFTVHATPILPFHHPSSSLPKHTNTNTPFPSLLFFSTSSLPNHSSFREPEPQWNLQRHRCQLIGPTTLPPTTPCRSSPTTLQGLAAVLRVSDALRVIRYICEVGVSPGEEIPFGKIVKCPSCRIAVGVAQPQQGSPPAERSMDITAWERGLRYVKLMKQSIPAAVHSIVVQTPSGLTRTHRFATETVDLPAQEGERVTVAVAALSNVYRKRIQAEANDEAERLLSS